MATFENWMVKNLKQNLCERGGNKTFQSHEKRCCWEETVGGRKCELKLD